MDGMTIQESSCVRLLGVDLDSGLTFQTHLEMIHKRALLRLNALKKLAGTDWGAETTTLRHFYTAWIRPVLEYASPVWGLASRKLLSPLDKIQNQALRLIAGANRFADLLSLHRDFDLEYLALRRLQAAARLAAQLDSLGPESACAAEWRSWKGTARRRLPTLSVDDPQHGYPIPKFCWSPFDFLRMGTAILALDPHLHMERLEERRHAPVPPPWTPPSPPPVHPLCYPWPVVGSAGKRSSKEQSAAEKWYKQVIASVCSTAAAEKKHLLLAHTDGSATWDVRGGGGAGIVWTAKRFPSHPGTWKMLAPNHVAVGVISDNFLAELAAISAAADNVRRLIHEQCWAPSETRLAIVSDCQEAVRAIVLPQNEFGRSYWTIRRRILDSLVALKGEGLSVSVEWVPGHTGAPLNEAADAAAKEAASDCREKGTPGASIPKPYSLVRAAVRLRVRSKAKTLFRRQ